MRKAARWLLQAAGGLLLALLALWLQRPGASAAEPPPAIDESPRSTAEGELGVPLAVRYQMRVRLDADTHRVHGEATVTWVNRSRLPQRELYLHLYLNAFKNDRSTFMRYGAASGFRGGGTPKRWGYIDIERVFARELDRDLWQDAERHSPGDAEDETDIRLPLPRAVEPGASLTLELAWVSQLPTVVHRTGYAGSFHMVAQWFPKLARLEPDGRWAHFAFHRLSEFYADFGDYDVRIDTPAGYVVGATGKQVEQSETSGRVARRFVAKRVHDFAFTAWDGFSELEAEGPSGVALRCLFPEGDDDLGRIQLAEVDAALKRMSAAYGAYPYDTLTIVHPPRDAPDAGGMEYPTLITTGGSWLAPRLGVRKLEIVTVHELAHQWFYGLLASDEHRWPFLDEGLTTYTSTLALEERYPNHSAFRGFGLHVGIPAFLRSDAARAWNAGVIAQPSADFASGGDYGRLVYSRAATLLDTLRLTYGDEAMAAALASYARASRFGHPTPDDLIAAVHAHVGADAAANLRRGLFERGWVDYLVGALSSEPDKPGRGLFGDPDAPDPGPATAGAGYRGGLQIKRRGTLAFPVEVELYAADGTRWREGWDGQGSHHTISYAGASPLVAAVIDPDVKLPIDQNLANNLRRVSPRRNAPRVLAHGALFAQATMAVLAP